VSAPYVSEEHPPNLERPKSVRFTQPWKEERETEIVRSRRMGKGGILLLVCDVLSRSR
jgi:hypothetical protein